MSQWYEHLPLFIVHADKCSEPFYISAEFRLYVMIMNFISNFSFIGHNFLPPAYVVWREGTVFTGVCLFTYGMGYPSLSHNTSTGPMSFPGVPHFHPIILPLVPCSLQGLVPQWLVPGHFLGGTQSQMGQNGGYPKTGTPQPGTGYPPGQGWGTPQPGMAYPLPMDGAPPSQGWGTFP